MSNKVGIKGERSSGTARGREEYRYIPNAVEYDREIPILHESLLSEVGTYGCSVVPLSSVDAVLVVGLTSWRRISQNDKRKKTKKQINNFREKEDILYSLW